MYQGRINHTHCCTLLDFFPSLGTLENIIKNMLSTPALLIINVHLKIIFVIWSINILHWYISTANNNTVCKQVCRVYYAKHPRFQIHSSFYHVTTTITVNVEYKLIRRTQCFSNDMQNTYVVFYQWLQSTWLKKIKPVVACFLELASLLLPSFYSLTPWTPENSSEFSALNPVPNSATSWRFGSNQAKMVFWLQRGKTSTPFHCILIFFPSAFSITEELNMRENDIIWTKSSIKKSGKLFSMVAKSKSHRRTPCCIQAVLSLQPSSAKYPSKRYTSRACPRA